ncbi:Hypothetical protein AKI40_4794 [Enterobacter sp. FY-07]|nr:Hypothetical protein AKI40_4794 [Enterobacter sp. FY-07]
MSSVSNNGEKERKYKEMEKRGDQKTKNPAKAGFKIGRRERIRTSDPLVPNQLRYQAALLADILLFEFFVQSKLWCEGGDLNPHVRKDTNT